MPRPSKGARLYLDPAERVWVIRDGAVKRRTGCGEGERGRAEEALARYIAEKYQPVSESRPALVGVADVLTYYAREIAPHHRSRATTSYAIDHLADWWGTRPLTDVKRSTCRDYVEHRTRQARPQAKSAAAKRRTISGETARRELTVLRAAINAYHAEHTLDAVPVVTLPEASPPRERWLTRAEAAAFLRAARRHPERPARRAIIRFFLVALYTGSRSSVVRTLGWMPNTAGGWIDVAAGVLHRRPAGTAETKKRAPPMRIPSRLLAHLERWRRLDAGIPHLIHHDGRRIASQRKAWAWARAEAGLGADVVPHVLRHTMATWAMLGGADPWDVASMIGMSPEMLWQVYGHHHPTYQSDLSAAMARKAPAGQLPGRNGQFHANR